MLRPTTSLVNGISKMSSIKNGILLKTFTIKSRTLYITLLGVSPSLSVTAKHIPSGNPTR